MSNMYCTCYCHYEDGVVHCFPCCVRCEVCGANIDHPHIEEHAKEHKQQFLIRIANLIKSK